MGDSDDDVLVEDEVDEDDKVDDTEPVLRCAGF